MKHIIFLFTVFLSSICVAQIEVTFRVDMQYQTVSSNGVHIAGAMQGWNPSATPLSDDDGDGIWEVTLNVSENTNYEYKFLNGNYWGTDESVWGDCGAGNGNRSLLTENQNILLPAYVFNSCDFTAFGCTDENAENYDSSANTDDGSCTYPQIYGCTDDLACNFNDNATQDDSSCVYANLGYDCDGNCIESDIDWIGDQNGDGFVSIDPNSGDVYITIESFPNSGTATLNINGNDYPMNYEDWGVNAHWHYSFSFENDSLYNWSVTISNNCDSSQSYSDSFTIDCQNMINGTSQDLGCGCGEPAQQVGYDCLGNCLVDTDLDGVCDEFEINGCTDNLACNFNLNATEDDSSCVYANLGYDCDGNCIESDIDWIGDQNGDGFVSIDPNSGDVYITIESFPNTGTATLNINGNDYPMNYEDWGVNAHWYYGFSFDNDSLYSWSVTISNNCNSSQSYSDSFTTGCNGELFDTCITRACDVVPTDLFVDNIINNRVTFNWSFSSVSPSDYAIRYKPIGDSTWTVITMEGETADSLPNSKTHRTRWWMSPATTYEWSVRSRVLNGDSSINCQSPWSAGAQYTTLPQCANLENLKVNNVEANWATFLAAAPDTSWGVWQSKGKMREVGTNTFRYVNGGSDGTIDGVLKGNFTASTDYEWHTKAWCTGNVDENGNPDPMYHSGWGDYSAFTTQAPCDKLPTNLTTVSNGANTAVTMSWDTPESGAPDHYFLEMTNLTTGAIYEWNYLDGESNSRTKFGQNPGDVISWRIRGACGSNGTSWATIFTQPVTFTLGGARLENSTVANLDVYPNPSRDIFNVTFTSEEAQTMTVKVVNMIGEEIFTEELTEFVGQYTQVIDMNTQPKGVYFLEITTSTGGINKKIVLQ